MQHQAAERELEGKQQTESQETARVIERLLHAQPASTHLLFEYACQLEAEGKSNEARRSYEALLQQEPWHLGALTNLANLLLAAKAASEARRLYETAVRFHPNDAASRSNLGNLLLRHGLTREAREHYERALATDPQNRAAHAGMSLALDELGQPEQAAEHRRAAFRHRCVSIAPYRGCGTPIAVLELISTTGGNVRTDDYLEDHTFQRIRVTPEFLDPDTVLPPHQLIVNAIGDADGAPAALQASLAVLALSDAPVINAPAHVLATGRCDIAHRLSSLPGVVTAKTQSLARESLLAPEAGTMLANLGFQFPILLRTPGFHGGVHFHRVVTALDLVEAVNQLPGAELLVIQYLDARGLDGKSRKYRVMMVDGKLYPLHLAISQDWKVHYYTADMADSVQHRVEEAAFLEDMTGVLGAAAIAALAQIQKLLSLDYGGIDFGLNDRGEVLLFEANATMAVIAPAPEPCWDYRREAVARIHHAVRTMLISKAIGG